MCETKIGLGLNEPGVSRAQRIGAHIVLIDVSQASTGQCGVAVLDHRCQADVARHRRIIRQLIGRRTIAGVQALPTP